MYFPLRYSIFQHHGKTPAEDERNKIKGVQKDSDDANEKGHLLYSGSLIFHVTYARVRFEGM